ncbi:MULTISPECIES: hypothetical protein [Methylobacterium]|uniref:hypothetical protein n=1 Tax=Methylobacterium TaxID=407 RepID=UPI0013EE2895|nr:MULTISPECIES: hypothetical protein [unclassified Methylobacterium]NGM37971.1 hypothetical protein [Methylobacterium sp. DB0501]
MRLVFEAGTTLRFEVSEPIDFRLSLDVGFATIVANGVEDVADLVAAFQLQDMERVSCHRYGFALDEVGEDADRRVVYRDKAVEVRILRSDYDRIAGVVADLIADPRVQAAFQQAYRRHAAASWEAAWHPGPGEA